MSFWNFAASALGTGASAVEASRTQARAVAATAASNAEARAEAERNRQFQERMSSTAFQRSVQDAQRSGLNPAVLFSQGGPASTPAGNMAPVQSAAESVTTSGLERARTFKDFAEMGSRVQRNRAETNLAGVLAEKGRQEAKTSASQARFFDRQADKSAAEAAILKPSVISSARMAEVERRASQAKEKGGAAGAVSGFADAFDFLRRRLFGR